MTNDVIEDLKRERKIKGKIGKSEKESNGLYPSSKNPTVHFSSLFWRKYFHFLTRLNGDGFILSKQWIWDTFRLKPSKAFFSFF